MVCKISFLSLFLLGAESVLKLQGSVALERKVIGGRWQLGFVSESLRLVRIPASISVSPNSVLQNIYPVLFVMELLVCDIFSSTLCFCLCLLKTFDCGLTTSIILCCVGSSVALLFPALPIWISTPACLYRSFLPFCAQFLAVFVAQGAAEWLLVATCTVCLWPHCIPWFFSKTCRNADGLESFSAVGRDVLANRLSLRLIWKKTMVTRVFSKHLQVSEHHQVVTAWHSLGNGTYVAAPRRLKTSRSKTHVESEGHGFYELKCFRIWATPMGSAAAFYCKW